MKPFSFGDHINGDWERYKYCPLCGEKRAGSCKCLASDSSCPNNHHWYNDWETNTIHPGVSPNHRPAYQKDHERMMELVK